MNHFSVTVETIFGRNNLVLNGNACVFSHNNDTKAETCNYARGQKDSTHIAIYNSRTIYRIFINSKLYVNIMAIYIVKKKGPGQISAKLNLQSIYHLHTLFLKFAPKNFLLYLNPETCWLF